MTAEIIIQVHNNYEECKYAQNKHLYKSYHDYNDSSFKMHMNHFIVSWIMNDSFYNVLESNHLVEIFVLHWYWLKIKIINWLSK